MSPPVITVDHPCVLDAVLHFRDRGATAGCRLRMDRSPWTLAPRWWPCWAAMRDRYLIDLSGERWWQCGH